MTRDISINDGVALSADFESPEYNVLTNTQSFIVIGKLRQPYCLIALPDVLPTVFESDPKILDCQIVSLSSLYVSNGLYYPLPNWLMLFDSLVTLRLEKVLINNNAKLPLIRELILVDVRLENSGQFVDKIETANGLRLLVHNGQISRDEIALLSAKQPHLKILTLEEYLASKPSKLKQTEK